MKVSDLMIGDFVRFDEDTCVIEELRVDGTTILVAMNTDLTSVDGDQVDVEELYPIPLTEDILVKNGFTKDYRYDGNQIEYDLDGFPITVVYNKNKKEWYAGTYMFGRESDWVERQFDCRFLHQLQHLLGLCGIDKKIEL